MLQQMLQTMQQAGIAAKAFYLPFPPVVQGNQVNGQHQIFPRGAEAQSIVTVADFLHAQPAEVMLGVNADVYQQVPLQRLRRLQEVGVVGLWRLNTLYHLQNLFQFVGTERVVLRVQSDAGVVLQQTVNTGKAQQLGEAGRLFQNVARPQAVGDWIDQPRNQLPDILLQVEGDFFLGQRRADAGVNVHNFAGPVVERGVQLITQALHILFADV